MRDQVGLYWTEARYDVLALLRSPGFYLPSLLFPTVFYAFFGILLVTDDAARMTLFVGYACFALIGPAMFNFAIYVASDRQQGWLILKSLTPMPTSAYVIAKLVSSLLFSLVAFILIALLALFYGDIQLLAGQWLLLLLVLLLGSLPFALLGLLIGLHSHERAAPIWVNLLYLPLSLLGGLWLPLTLLPETLQHLAWALPTYHLAQIGMAVVTTDYSLSLFYHIAYLVSLTLLLWLAAGYYFPRRALAQA
ncbi:ABC transporter permease [Idiomarina xiamenensis]|nr:ABC transporter permease [Idiomarina xiamenensis]